MEHYSDEVILRYLDDDLEGAERVRVESHLHECQLCRDVVSGYTNLSLRAQELDVAEWDSQEFISQLQNRICAEGSTESLPGGNQSSRSWVRWAIAASLLVVTVTGGRWYEMRQQYQEDLKIQSQSFVQQHYAMRIGDLGLLDRGEVD